MKKRVFVAIELPTEFRKIIANYIENLRKDFTNLRIGWDKEEKLHITLKFLGEIDETQLSKLNKSIEKIARQVSKFQLSINQTDAFANKILHLIISDESQNLLKLNDLLQNECEKFGIEKERRKFSPHVTLARIREPNSAKQLVKKHLQNEIETMQFEVNKIVIYESKLQPKGSLYYKLGEVKLAE
jgi:2'-5' RNA ligase